MAPAPRALPRPELWRYAAQSLSSAAIFSGGSDRQAAEQGLPARACAAPLFHALAVDQVQHVWKWVKHGRIQVEPGAHIGYRLGYTLAAYR